TELLRKEQENEKNIQEQIEDVQSSVQEKRVHNNKTDSGVVVEGVDNVLVRLSRCCNPVPNDDIVGFITKGRGVSVHRRDCPNVHFNQDQGRFIDVFWKSSTHSSKEYHLDMEISGYDRKGLLNEVLQVGNEKQTQIASVSGRADKKKIAHIKLTVLNKNKNQ